MTPQQDICRMCGYANVSVTALLSRHPNVLPETSIGDRMFEPLSTALLQVFPSGQCLTLGFSRPTILGRGDPTLGLQDFIDLSHFNAEKHGVSRKHCLLRRGDNQLVILDLHSTNGSYLNGDRIKPNMEYVLAHGDKLVLGSLHIVIFFNSL